MMKLATPESTTDGSTIILVPWFETPCLKVDSGMKAIDVVMVKKKEAKTRRAILFICVSAEAGVKRKNEVVVDDGVA